MSGVYIKGMEMPERCYDCDLCYDFYRCLPLGVNYYCHETNGFDPADERLPNCPLVPVPPHGRLIDADAFTKDECNYCDGACEALPCDCLNCEADCRCDFMKDIADAPTIIPAEEEQT